MVAVGSRAEDQYQTTRRDSSMISWGIVSATGNALVSDRVYGRDRELSLLRRALDDTAAGAGGCHLLGGAAGIGKSRLLRVAGDMADKRSIAVAAREAFPHDLAAP